MALLYSIVNALGCATNNEGRKKTAFVHDLCVVLPGKKLVICGENRRGHEEDVRIDSISVMEDALIHAGESSAAGGSRPRVSRKENAQSGGKS